jgi:hypothetical protein
MDVLQEFGMSECTPVSTPMSTRPFKLVNTKFNKKEMPYAKQIGKLLYASKCTRPHITASVNYLSRYMPHLSVEHWLQGKTITSLFEGFSGNQVLYLIGLFRILQLLGTNPFLLMDLIVNRVQGMPCSCVDLLLHGVYDFNLL